jgi:TRAP-type C4-dicarboxylate transport system substrate-binding protein
MKEKKERVMGIASIFKRALALRRSLFLASVFALSSLLCVSFSQEGHAASATKSRVLKFAYYMLPDTPTGKAIAMWCSMVENRTGGQIKFKIFPAESLATAPEAIDMASRGLIDLTLAVSVFESGKMPFSAGISVMPFAWKYEDTPEAYYEKGLYDLQEYEYARLKLHRLWVLPSYGQEFMFRKPVKNLQDLKGLKIRAAGGLMEKIVKVLGATPVAMPSVEIYTSAQRGTIDGASWNYSRYFHTKTNEVLPYIVVVGYSSESGLANIVINSDVWNSLPTEIQKIMSSAAKEAEKWHMLEEKRRGLEMLEEAKAEGRVDVYVLPPEERVHWIERCAPLYDEIQKQWGEKGKKAVQVARYYQKKYAEQSH